MLQRNILLTGFLCLATSLSAQKKDDKKWDVNNPPGTYKQVEINTSEGTWMNLDVSPDGKEIVFDMLGDIFTIPVTGGEAKILRSGMAWEVQPRYSPNGKKISFTSDAGGGDNIWTMNRDGSDEKQVTKETFRLLNNAVWSPDGDYFLARKHFTNTRSAGAGEIWMYHKTGGDGFQLVKKKNDQQDIGEPCISPDGRYIYYSEDMYPGGYFQYNKDPNKEIYAIKRFDRETGKTETVVKGPGGAARPQISRDGKKLAFVRRVREKSVLFIYDLKSAEEWPVYTELSKDQQEAWALFGVYTNFNWLPDNKHIIIWAKGKLWKINTETRKADEIPFKVSVKHKIYDAVKTKQPVAPDEFTVKTIRNAVTSPDGKTLIFNAVGHLWKKQLPDGKPVRLTQSTDLEFEPSFSTDGKEIVYVSWNDANYGAVMKLNLKGGKAQRITLSKGIYRTPSYSADGKWIVFVKEEGNDHQGFSYSTETGIYVVPATGGEGRLVSSEGEFPQFSKDGKRIYYQTGGYLFGSLDKAFKSVDLYGKDERTHFTSKYANRFVLSSDNKWVAFNELFKVYIAPFAQTGKPVDLSGSIKTIPVSQVSRDAGINIHWSADNKKLHWTLGDEYFTNEITKRFTFLEGSADSIPPLDTTGIKIGLQLKSDKPGGIVAFTNARIITMKGDEVIENGTLVVNGNRIVSVGKSGEVTIPKEAKIIDAKGKTIMPGMVDVHAHLGTFRYGLSPQKQWSYYANLAYGVTTTHDPSSNTEMVFSQSEMVRSGKMVGPRIFSTGIILYGAEGDFKAVINNYEDALSALRRTKAFGAFSVKSYNQPRRDQRQQVINAARELGMMVVPEGGSHFQHNMSMIADGHTGIEHNIPVAPLYDDVVQFWSASKTGYTPTLIVNYGGINGEYYYYERDKIWENNKLMQFVPQPIIDSRARHRTIIPDEEYQNGHVLVSQSCKKLSDKGVKVNLGSHGQLQGLGAHWELWMLQSGGMSNLEALRSVTLNSAAYIGMDGEIGSLENGKLADLMIMEKNPLENIRNTETIQYVMINGRLYDTETMNEIGNYDNKRTAFYWQLKGQNNNFPFYESTNSFQDGKCGCGKH